MKIDRIAPPSPSIGYDRNGHDRAILSFIRKLAALLTLRQALLLVSVWCFVWGLIALILRAVGGVARGPLLWGLVGCLVAVAAAAIAARRQLPSRAAVRALLDRQNACGGLLMASEQVSLGDWQSRIPELTLPRLKWKSHRAWGLLASAIVFVIASLAVPVRYASVQTARTLDVRREVEELAEKIETLKETELLEGAQGQTFQQQLDQLAREASGEDPAKTWEALDHLADVVEAAAKEGAESATAQQEKLAQAEALSEGLLAGADRMDPKLMTEAMQTLSEMMKNALDENQALATNLSPQLQEAIKSGTLKPEQLKDLSAALSQNRAALDQKLSKLNQSGQSKMIDSKSLKGGAQSNRRDNSGLSRFLEENAQRMSVEDAVGEWCSGKGGVDRGRGDAAMSWTDGTSEKDARFKEKALPPSAVAGLKDSQLVGLSVGTPTAGNNAAAHGALNQSAQGGGSAYTQTILPRHKGAVKRYFERPQNH